MRFRDATIEWADDGRADGRPRTGRASVDGSWLHVIVDPANGKVATYPVANVASLSWTAEVGSASLNEQC